MKKLPVLGITINNPSVTQTTKLISQFVLAKKPHQIVTANPEMLMAAQKDQELAAVINTAELVVPDGIGLVWAIRYLYNIKAERITGIDLIDYLAQIAEKSGHSIFFLGAKPGIAQKAAKNLQDKYPHLRIAGIYAGNPDLQFNQKPRYNFPYDLRVTDIKLGHKDPNLAILTRVKKAKPDILLVAYGHGKQEKFISRYKKVLRIPVMMGVGGAFDFIAGKAARAPKWLQNLGLEWFWRLIHEPWRFKRIITAVFRFPWAVLVSKLKKP